MKTLLAPWITIGQALTSSKKLLSVEVDARGQYQDGFLHARVVYNLELRADLVVLSGCWAASRESAVSNLPK